MPTPGGAPAGDAGGAPRRWRLSILPSSAGPYKWKTQVAQVSVYVLKKYITVGTAVCRERNLLALPTLDMYLPLYVPLLDPMVSWWTEHCIQFYTSI